MKHPQREELVPFLFGEASPEAGVRLTAHLDNCPECAAEIAAWRRSLGRLEEWRLPAPASVPPAVASGVRWALAASIVLGLGFGLGWVTKPSGPDAAQVQAQVRSSVNAALLTEMRPQIAAEVERVAVQTQEGTEHALAALESRLARTSETGLRQVLQGLTTALDTAREEDRQAFSSLLDHLQEQRTTDYVSLRKDLETLATLTDEEMRQARSRLNQLAARTSPDDEP